MKHMVDKITGFGAKDVKVCVLLHKKNPENLKLNFFADYTGYFVPCKFVLGYGMDYNELCRDMRHVCIISQYGIDKYKQWEFYNETIAFYKIRNSYSIHLIKHLTHQIL